MGTELGAEGLSPVLPRTRDVGLAAWHLGGPQVQGTAPCPGQGQPHGWHIATPQMYRECQPQPHGTASPTQRTRPHVPCRGTATPRDRTLSLARQCHPPPQGSASPGAPHGRAGPTLRGGGTAPCSMGRGGDGGRGLSEASRRGRAGLIQA